MVIAKKNQVQILVRNYVNQQSMLQQSTKYSPSFPHECFLAVPKPQSENIVRKTATRHAPTWQWRKELSERRTSVTWTRRRRRKPHGDVLVQSWLTTKFDRSRIRTREGPSTPMAAHMVAVRNGTPWRRGQNVLLARSQNNGIYPACPARQQASDGLTNLPLGGARYYISHRILLLEWSR